MKLVIGLGNPDKKLINTRHNLGFMVLDLMAEKKKWHKSSKGKLEYVLVKINGQDVELVKPQTFMNNSGFSAAYVKKKHSKDFTSDKIYVIHDDLDIALGEYKIQFGKGPKQHKGVKSIENHLKTKDFWRLRIGVENRTDKKIPGDEYVLQNFSIKERVVINQVIDQAVKELKSKL